MEILFTNKQHLKLAVVAEWSKAISQIQVERMPQVPGLYSNFRFVSGSQMVRCSHDDQKTGWKKPVFSPKCLLFEWSAKSLNTFTVRYSVVYCIFPAFRSPLKLQKIAKHWYARLTPRQKANHNYLVGVTFCYETIMFGRVT